ncbi:hypothetical protein HN695_00800 [Candidatus Woesearchaeota archaeon]|jgi:Ni,Fe-hydrogenase maturation factor|nr:hypothetical protein [Candidatus Woesearchaeota archaeon]MBT5272788.1 hypothetical protein [Candidatus Woesearchaeota archaeon]MBT6040400.1 hypothetical protein [Candidatus Woesearchaeota archaeon]MBT7926853.1 hypothetical protein [Candidatus Woesearchaeota archaeon]
MKTILCFGNEFIKQDSLAKEIANEINMPEIEFIMCDSPDDILEFSKISPNKEIIILDVVQNIEEPMIINNIDDLEAGKLCTLHDFDVGFFLKLMKELGQIKDIKIIGIPQTGDKEKIKKEVIRRINDSSE